MSGSMVLSLVDVTTHYDRVFWFEDFNFHLNEDCEKVDAILIDNTEDNMDILLQYD